MKRFLSLLLVQFIASFAVYSQVGDKGNVDYHEHCLQNIQYVVGKKYTTLCTKKFHHYNVNAVKNHYSKNVALAQGQVKIAGFNIFRPGTRITPFKDFKLVASMMNRWDIIGTTELLATVGNDLTVNNAVMKFIHEGLAANLQESRELYRAPSYLVLLKELRKLDPSWALILSPKGEAAKDSDIHELIGYYYRARVVHPVRNKYCSAFACLPEFENNIFARRPFMGSFKSGDFSFTLLTSHNVYTSPYDNESIKQILMTTFGVESYKDLGVGINKQNYARFAEVKTTLDFMKKMKEQYGEQDVILVGDFNLESSNKFWPEVLSSFPGAELFIEQKTTLTNHRYDKYGNETDGYASDYDHFIFDPQSTSECGEAKRFDLINSDLADEIRSTYIVRDEEKVDGIYPIPEDKEEQVTVAINSYSKKLKKLKTVKWNQIVWDDYKYLNNIEDFERRIFRDQQYDQTYHRLFKELISDHTPISINCRNTSL